MLIKVLSAGALRAGLNQCFLKNQTTEY